MMFRSREIPDVNIALRKRNFNLVLPKCRIYSEPDITGDEACLVCLGNKKPYFKIQ